MRIMSLDIGDKRIGIAVSDALGITSQGIETLQRKDETTDFQYIAELVKQYEVEKVVAGLPRNMNGTYGPQSEKVKDFMSRFQEVVPLEVIFWDERLTTVAAQRTLIEGDMSRKKRKQVVDKIAAVLILQGYLDRSR